MRLVGEIAILAAEHTEVGRVVSEKSDTTKQGSDQPDEKRRRKVWKKRARLSPQMSVTLSTPVTEVSVALRTSHVIASLYTLDVDLKIRV